MTVPYKLPEPKITDSDVSRWLRKNHLKKTQVNITRATNALRAEKQADSIPLGRDVSVVATDAARQIIYGYSRIGGTITFMDVRASNQYIDLIITLTGHEINAVSKLYVDDCEVIFQSGDEGWAASFRKPDGTIIDATNKLFMRVTEGADNQAAIGDLTALNPRWTSNHRQRSCAHAYIILVWDGLLYGDGIPDFQFLIEGKKVYDPRTATTYFSNLSALVAADYLMDTRIGMSVPSDRIDMGTDPGGLQWAADVCGESVGIIGGGTEVRYAANGSWQTDENHGRVLERIAASMGGHITYSNGLWKFWPATWQAPSITLDEDDLRGPIRMQTMVARDDAFNTVRGRFVSAAKGYIETDYPTVKNASYITDDGEVLVENIDFNLVTSSPACQRLAKLEIERNRQGISLEVPVSLKAYQLQVPENVSLNITRYGWTGKTFEVTRADLGINEGSANQPPELIVMLSLRETASGVFDWADGTETYGDLAPNTNLPSPFVVPSISGLMLSSGTSDLYLRGDGTVAPRIKVSWTALSDFFVTSGGRIEIQFKPSSSSDWIDSTSIPGSSTFAYLADVRDGVNYDVRVRAVNAFQNAGPYTSVMNHFVVGKTAPPSDVTGFAAVVTEYGISFAWNKISDLDVKEYEIREGSVWATGTFVARTRSTKLNLDVRASGSYTFKIKAIDTTENYSTTEATATVTITSPSILAATFSFDGPNAVIDWDEATLGSWAIDIYDVYYGDVFATATFLLSTKSSVARVVGMWEGVRRFWIVARDIYGNQSTEISVDVLINPPNAMTVFSATVIDNNVLARWSEPAASTLPIAKYVLKKGDTYGTAEEIGETSGTFSVIFELIADQYTYWVEAVDTAGNHGAPLGTTVTVNEPPDFELIADQALSAGTVLNVLERPDGTLRGAVNITRTWSDHFSISGWTNPQDQITAGFPVFIQPTREYGRWEKIVDLGTTVNNVLIHLSFTREDMVGSVVVTPKIAYSTDGVSYTEEVDVLAVLAAAVRYIRTRIDFGTVP